MRRIQVLLLAVILLISSGVQAGTLHTLIDARTAISGTAIDTNATTCADDSDDLQVVTVAAHGLTDNDSVYFAAGTGAVCTGITAGEIYYVTQVDSTTTFNISSSYPIAGTPTSTNIAYTDAGTAFTTNTSGYGAPVKLGNDYEDFGCVVTWSGTAPTNTTVKVYAGIDGDNYSLLDTQTVTASGSNFAINNYTNMYLLGEFSAKTGGDATTAVTLKCVPGRN